MNKNYCALLWNHFMINQDSKMTKPCCVHKNYFPMLSDINKTGSSTPLLKTLRATVLKSEDPLLGCDECYRDEAVKGRSLRTQANTVFKNRKKHYIQNTDDDGTYKDFKLEWLDIRWSNLCNYKCRFCSLSSSNSWLSDHLLLDELPPNFNEKTGIIESDVVWSDLKQYLPDVRFIKLAGGEPLMMEGTYQLLEEMIRINKTDVHILLNTNASFSKYGNKDIINLLSNFKKVDISLSIDGINEAHNYLRSGKKDWKKVEENIDKFLNSKNNVKFLSSVSWINSVHMIEVFKKYPHVNIIFNSVTIPEFMSLGYLPKKLFKRLLNNLDKEEISNKHKLSYKKWLTKQYRETAISNTRRMELKEQFLFFINKLDETRGQNFITTFPEWQNFYREIIEEFKE